MKKVIDTAATTADAASAIFAARSWSGPSAVDCWYWVETEEYRSGAPVFGSRYRTRRLTSLSSELALAANSAAVPRSTTATDALATAVML